MTVINTAPTLITERLRLDAHTLDDFDSLAALWADPLVVRYIGGTPRDREDSWGRLMRYVGHWALLGYGYWAVRDKQSGEYLGSIGFSNFLRDITPALDAPEMGWTLVSSAHGKGYATEALRAALAWGKTHLPGKKPSASSRLKTRLRWRWRKRSASAKATAASTIKTRSW
ncbi:GNAT family N-acetyltransferase [Serratia sp. B1]|nr:GNAT family N-acetyltransferase [Serratia sp. B1]